MTVKKQIQIILALIVGIIAIIQFVFLKCNENNTASEAWENVDNVYGGRRISIGFYNTENFFDTKDEVGKNDEEFLPRSAKKYTQEVYALKVQHVAEAIASIEQANPEDTLALVGLVEVENLGVLEDLLQQNPIKTYNWQIIHKESSDPRGIDAALLYNPLFFVPKNVALISPFGHAREILQVSGILLGKPTHIFVNHWTSRLNGSENKRALYAQKMQSIIDNIKNKVPKENVILMGDFNDNPTDKSVQNILGASTDPTSASPSLYNPFHQLYTDGIGSGVYENEWTMFDQMMILTQRVTPQQLFEVTKANVVKANFLLTTKKRSHPIPKKFYHGNTLIGGYSDHLPIFVQIR